MMKGNYEEMAFCGCGELNPIENDPELKTIGVGTRVLINGASGFGTGSGTRSSEQKPNLTGFADMHEMNSEFMGRFTTGHGPDIITTWAVAISVLDRDMRHHILKTDDQIPLTVWCFNCGHCVTICMGKLFYASTGTVNLNGVSHAVPITLRQSNRAAAMKAANDLKHQIQKKQFTITAPVEK